MMKKTFLSILPFIFFVFILNSAEAQTSTEDTTVVQCFTYQSPQDAWFNFPSDTNQYRKILMMYNLHCPDPTQCGEWDYLTYTFLYDHTGVMDSTLLNHSSFTVDGNSPDSISYMNSPSYSYQTSLQYSLIIDSTISSNLFSIGTGTQSSVHPFNTTADARARSVYLWKASELSSAGLTAGNISSIKLTAAFSWSTELNHLKIRLASTNIDSMEDGLLSASWVQVFDHNTYLSTGANTLQFIQPYLWDGTSNLLIEVCYDNDGIGWDNLIETTPEIWSAGITSSGNDRNIFFNGSEFVQVPKEAFSSIDSFVTVAYWSYGDPSSQPNDGTCFEAVAADGHRILNAHCPWSNSNIYWDAGSDGSNFDRINYAATTAQTEGQWNYWAFTKNIATGSMKIYLNGNLWNSATGMTKPMNGIEYFRIGKGNWNGAQSYRGAMDEFSVWNTELNAATIQEYMYKDIDALHPNYSNLVCYYNFNVKTNNTFADGSSGNHTAIVMSNLDNPFVSSQTLFRNYVKIYERPNITFEQGIFNSHLDSTLVIDTIENAPFTIVLYGDSLNPTTATDTVYVWSNFYTNYLYNNAGNAIDSSFENPDDTLYKQTWYYYSAPFEIVDRYELGRFITLYGNGTTVGPNGRTWVYDLTNLAPLLHDSVHLSAGNWQEWLDMKFIMIKGKPARDPISVKNLWNGYGYSYDANIENALTPIRLKIDPAAKNTMWRTITTGHGMNGPQNCAEFCAKYQYGKVNGVQQFQQLIWRDDCGRNPLYPQGGTWVYQRANWCPGAEVWEYNWELTPYVTPGDSETIDLNLEPYSGSNGTYVIASQLISFKEPNFTLDAEMYDILTPSDKDEWSRLNPICSEPTVRIRNGGTTPLTSATITYGLVGGAVYTYNWTGTLGFLQKADVTLPSMWWVGDGTNKFYATISSPNGGIDGNSKNDKATSHFNAPAVYNLSASTTQKFIVEVKTNAYGFETSYQLRKTGGIILVDRNNLAANTTYKDTISFNSYECYTFEIFDAGEDGLSFWANSAQGSGYSRIKKAELPTILKAFPSDFGAEYIHNFKINFPLDVNDIPKVESSMDVVPNPAIDMIDVTMQLPDPSDKVIATILDLSGRELKKQIQAYSIATEFNFGVNNLAPGLYFVKVKSGNQEFVQKFLKLAE